MTTTAVNAKTRYTPNPRVVARCRRRTAPPPDHRLRINVRKRMRARLGSGVRRQVDCTFCAGTTMPGEGCPLSARSLCPGAGGSCVNLHAARHERGSLVLGRHDRGTPKARTRTTNVDHRSRTVSSEYPTNVGLCGRRCCAIVGVERGAQPSRSRRCLAKALRCRSPGVAPGIRDCLHSQVEFAGRWHGPSHHRLSACASRGRLSHWRGR
jgi:hypothetical protein